MTQRTHEHVFHGTPDQWWDQAEPITEAEAADRELGTWYITAETRHGVHTGSYRLGTTTLGSNVPRREALRRRLAMGEVRDTDLAPNVRALIRIPIVHPDWMHADLVIADSEIGSDVRVPWRQTRSRWHQVFSPNKAAGERTMAQLNPRIATITQTTEEGI